MTRIIAIHQPNFFPWLGYFDKIANCDLFVMLDHVQYPKTGASWSNRVLLRIGSEPRWVTAPICRTHHGVASVNQVCWAENAIWRTKFLKSLNANYAGAPYFRQTMSVLEPLILYPETKMASYNKHAIVGITRHLGLDPGKFVHSSELAVATHGTEMLIEITKKLEGSVYMCGGGASLYQEDAAFSEAGIQLQYQQFEHPIYPQGKHSFKAGLSVIDALMHNDVETVRRFLRMI